jgi:hypothetical protein
LEGDHDGTYKTSGLVCSPESRSVAAMEPGGIRGTSQLRFQDVLELATS